MNYIDTILQYFEPCRDYTCSVVRIKEIMELTREVPYKSNKEILELLKNYGYACNSREQLKLRKKRASLKALLIRLGIYDTQKYLLKNRC